MPEAPGPKAHLRDVGIAEAELGRAMKACREAGVDLRTLHAVWCRFGAELLGEVNGPPNHNGRGYDDLFGGGR